jgi:hypothetical protein
MLVSMNLLFMAMPQNMAQSAKLLFGESHEIYAANSAQLQSIVKGLMLALFAPQTNVEVMIEDDGYMTLCEFVGLDNKTILDVYVEKFDGKRPSEACIANTFSRLIGLIDREKQIENDKISILEIDPSLENYAYSR